ncbi:AEC family transporter [Xanthobacter sp. TB0136]|uniref:AEC family transporter n=1 Tax=Xanthobacter sp. TB0136 TaxID=3459177 RepID=UPI00403A5788
MPDISGMVILALLPVALLIALGYVLKRTSFIGESFWPQAERLTYYVLMPCLFLHGMSTADISTLPVRDIVLTLLGSTVLVSLLLVVVRPAMGLRADAFTSVFQGSVRFNSYIGVTLGAGLLGPKAIALVAVCSAVLVPLVNLLSILVFARFGAARLNARQAAIQVATNPLVLSCLGGIALQLMNLHLPPGVQPGVKALGTAAMPMGLLCVGAALHFGSARNWVKPILIASLAKFLILPLVTFLIAQALQLDATAMLAVLIFQTLPTASSSYILSRQLGGDAPLMAGITALQTVLAALLLPLMLSALLP